MNLPPIDRSDDGESEAQPVRAGPPAFAPSSGRLVPTVRVGRSRLKGKVAVEGMAGQPSIAKRSRAHFGNLWALVRRVHEDGVITSREDAEVEQAMREHSMFELAGDTAHQVRQATDRATDAERLDEVWNQHRAVLGWLPEMPLATTQS